VFEDVRRLGRPWVFRHADHHIAGFVARTAALLYSLSLVADGGLEARVPAGRTAALSGVRKDGYDDPVGPKSLQPLTRA
jgi:hypothetical protein